MTKLAETTILSDERQILIPFQRVLIGIIEQIFRYIFLKSVSENKRLTSETRDANQIFCQSTDC